MINGSTYSEEIIMISIYALSNWASNYIKQKTDGLKEKHGQLNDNNNGLTTREKITQEQKTWILQAN
jgi:hypothetical protein